MEKKEKYKVIGLMSGTSLDGLDIAYCTFEKKNDEWKFKIEQAKTVAYPKRWAALLENAKTMSAEHLAEIDVEYGKFLGEQCASFIADHKINPDFITSHGHTIFHQPHHGFTLQIGNGNAIHAMTNLPVICDLRSLDVIRGGQGAPLVPVGDRLLFSEYDVCLNLGGIANLSVELKKQRMAFDVCFVNMAFNYLAQKKGKSFDKHGNIASEGEVNKILVRNIDKVYAKLRSKRPSLGREIFESLMKPLLDDSKISIEDNMRTVAESSAKEIVNTIRELKKDARVLCTGGGAFNSFFMTRMLELAEDDMTFVIADDEIVKFKEALIFAFLGVLRVRDEVNCLKSVTGASKDSSGGILVGF
jgi:anhydro-N-acetylmuramic acid kinase